MLSVNASSLGNSSSSPGQPSLAGQVVVDEQGKKREVRLMKNRYTCMLQIQLAVDCYTSLTKTI